MEKKKPEIDIHLLGCTELAMLHECRFCTSADSTTWVGGKRFGFIEGNHITTIKTKKVREMVGNEIYDEILSYNKKEYNTNFLCLNIERLKKDYQRIAGNQDYYNNERKEDYVLRIKETGNSGLSSLEPKL